MNWGKERKTRPGQKTRMAQEEHEQDRGKNAQLAKHCCGGVDTEHAQQQLCQSRTMRSDSIHHKLLIKKQTWLKGWDWPDEDRGKMKKQLRQNEHQKTSYSCCKEKFRWDTNKPATYLQYKWQYNMCQKYQMHRAEKFEPATYIAGPICWKRWSC